MQKDTQKDTYDLGKGSLKMLRAFLGPLLAITVSLAGLRFELDAQLLR